MSLQAQPIQAFYTYFLNRWNEARHPDYDFDSGELVYRNIAGQEAHRTPFPDDSGTTDDADGTRMTALA
jgi:hypothetical protein